ncbi:MULTISPECIES: DEAD/DEAH box helicase [unclassified Roseateles]|uniref:DEAD/DEAH box helicase n=1 Tax=unclassified Roseateles TaxID=2626991 RepID=UPI0006F2E2E7|nr:MULTISPECIES: AAA domain-containing protein [unclassified Roseateles]KQW52066.1 DNA helicase [Pelomonas sp. Root405]KRA78300.1 DNA helicase [Pelomonas sp. Root662]
MSLADVRAALTAELSATPEFYDFKVLHTERDGALWRVTLEPGYVFAEGQRPGAASAQALLDDSLDGASAWWGAPAKGGASVLAVVAEDDQLVLQNASSAPPPPDHLIRLYPTRFLNAVADAWWDTPWAERALACLPDLSRPQRVDAGPALTGAPFRWLRTAQREALALVGHSSAFLWGPPGTGKTTTLGVLLAEYLDTRPDARVLLLSTTNHAVDLATLAVDKALQKGRREQHRPCVQRLGTRFDAAAYAGREHLIPTEDADLIARLARAESQRPSARDANALKAWADRVAALRDELRAASLKVLRRCRLAAMTTTRAAFTLKSLRELSADDEPPFDLVVFDEASQVSLAHALVLMPLGHARLFAGDPQQLSPVLRSEDRGARRWLGRSAFGEMPRKGASVALLDEQSRMAAPIGDLVSQLFYDGALRVATDTTADWQAARRRALGAIGPDEHVQVHRMQHDGGWSAQARGPVRRESAEAIAELIAGSLTSGAWRPDELIVLTPFRAQRALIRRCLQARGLPDSLRVSTVHRAQGSEAPVVLFDPADGAQLFLQGEEAQRLLNVALSRAQAKLVVFVSGADATSPFLAPLVQKLRLAADDRTAQPLIELARQPGFPANAIGRRVTAGRHSGEVARVSADGSQFWLINASTGAQQVFDTDFWRQRASGA